MRIKQAANVLALIEFFAERLRPATAAEITEALGWPRSSTFNMIGTLTDLGYLYEPRGRGGYYPTSRWLSLSQAISQTELLPEPVLDMVAAIARETGETAMVSVPAGIYAIMSSVIESQADIRYFAREGNRLPIHATATGRAILAQMTAAQRKAIYRKITFEAYGPTTPVTRQEVEERLLAGMKRGYQSSDGEFSPHLVGVALPLGLEHRKLAVTVAGPQFRCLERIEEFAAVISRQIELLDR
ncbi:MAG: helix-turn-helix domain-containing protein [Sphingomonadaceae bacterium]|nr:helix-turn-helix domain-containing protein [Sphingomonadaceae bacterium]